MKDKQPAKLSYFFGPGWKELGTFIKEFWKLNKNDIFKRADKVENGKGIISFSGAINLLWCMSLILFGTLFFCILSSVISVALGCAFLIMYVIIAIIWVIDRLYLLQKRIFVACPNCKGKYLIPTYICPKCGRKHTRLTPGKYGVLKRICECGEEMPTHFLTKREKLPAECPKCNWELSGTGSRPICIPIVGGRSSGKTAYITAYTYDFIEKVAPRIGVTIEHYDEKLEEFYKNDICNDYLSGTTRMTKTEMDIRQASSKAFSFLIKHPKLTPDRVVHIYDVAGESFVDNTENEVQLQYSYCNGIIFMVDPLAISIVRNYIDDGISEVDSSSVGTLDVDIVLDSFMNKLRQITGQSSNKMFNIPIAIVISKSDIKTLEQFIGEEKISTYMTEHNLGMELYSIVEDRLIREFLLENGLSSFVSNIDMRFKNNRYFKCSSIGHTRETGKYNPKGVLEPMEWIFQNADNGMKSIWHETEFKNVMRGDDR